MARKNLEVEVPNSKPAELVRERSLRKPIFTRTRIVTLSLILVLSLSIAGTLAYLTYTTNQTPNRVNEGTVGLIIVENGTDQTTGANTVDQGAGNKEVQVKSEDNINRADELVRISFLPEVQDADGLGSLAISENWSAPQVDSSGNYYIQTDVIKLNLASDWQSYYKYRDGAFYYYKVVPKNTTTEKLLTGATLVDGVNAGDYGTITVKVVADAIQAYPEEAASAWKCTVDSDGLVTLDS